MPDGLANQTGTAISPRSQTGLPASASASLVGAPSANGVQSFDRMHPYAAQALSLANLNQAGSAKDTRHVVLDLKGGDITYEVGDSLGVYPVNDPELVERIIQALHADDHLLVAGHDGHQRTLRETLLTTCDLRDIDDASALLLAEIAKGSEADRLKALVDDDDRMFNMDVLDLLDMFPDIHVDAERLVSTLAPLAPRLYSISSSLHAHPHQVHLTIAKSTIMVEGRLRKGVASTMFTERLSPGDHIPVFVQTSHDFRLPADGNTPIIMIGPGTGIAPFRAFLQSRQATGATGDAWLFFGDWHHKTDFLYQHELTAYLENCILTRLDTAFSRDQKEKIYVQHRMREHGATLYRWLEQGAYVYVCGDAKRMAGDVDRALCDIVAQHGSMAPEDAKAYIVELSRSKRYLRDVY